MPPGLGLSHIGPSHDLPPHRLPAHNGNARRQQVTDPTPPKVQETAEHYLATHGDILLKVLQNCEKRAAPPTEDSNDALYWQHEQRALQQALDRLNAPAPASHGEPSRVRAGFTANPGEPVPCALCTGVVAVHENDWCTPPEYVLLCLHGDDADIVHVVWDGQSQGCLFDLGVAFALGKALRPIELPAATEGKSFQNMMRAWAGQ